MHEFVKTVPLLALKYHFSFGHPSVLNLDLNLTSPIARYLPLQCDYKYIAPIAPVYTEKQMVGAIACLESVAGAQSRGGPNHNS